MSTKTSNIAMSLEEKKQLSKAFGYDVSTLPEYVDESSENFITTLVESSMFMSKHMIEENVKGKKTIKLLNADLTLQTMEGCTPSPDGSVVFTGRNIETKKLYVGVELCNEDLNGKYTQLLNSIGAGRQDEELPLEDVLLAHLGKVVKRKAQKLIVNGDETSGNPELAIFDGARKLLKNDPLVEEAQFTGTGFDATNGFDVAMTVYNKIKSEVFDDGLNVVLLTGRPEGRAIIDQVWNDKDFNANIDDRQEVGGQLTFTLPTTDMKIETIPELSGTNEMYAYIYDYAFIGTDDESDMDDLYIVWDNYNRKLKVEGIFRLGYQFVQPQYWVRLNFVPAS